METISIGAVETNGLIDVTIIGKGKGNRSIGLNKESNFWGGFGKTVFWGIFTFNGIIVKSSGGAFFL